MNGFMSFLSSNAETIRIVVGITALLLIAYIYRRQLGFLLMDWRYTFPYFGKIARLSNDATHSAKEGWTNAEKTLCSDYKKHIAVIREPEFERGITYLKKSDDLGRSTMPGWAIVFFVGLIAMEGLGFSYLLGTWLAMDGSANIHMILMIAIVFVICAITAVTTHAGGHQLYKFNLVTKCFKLFKAEGVSNRFGTKNIALNDNQSMDDADPEYIQCVNRVDTGKSLAALYLAAFVIVIIATLSTYMRWENLKGNLVKQSAAQSQAVDSGNPFAAGVPDLPQAVTASQKTADDKANNDVRNATEGEGLAAFAMLGFIFVVTQIVGIGAGYKYGFAGKESKSAFKSTGGFSTYDEYLTFYEPRMHLAEARLQALQQRMEEHSHHKNSFSMTFADYLDTLGRPSASRDAFRSSQQPREMEPRPIAPTAQATASAESILTVGQALSVIDGMADKGAKKDYMLTLPESLANQVKLAIKQRKDQAAKRQADAELDDLFD